MPSLFISNSASPLAAAPARPGQLIFSGLRGNEWVRVDHFSLKSAEASRSVLSVEDAPGPAAHRRGAA